MTEHVERKKTIRIDPFNYTMHIILSNDIQTSRENRSKLLGSYVRDGCTRALHTAVDDDSISYVFLEYETDIGFVVHEIFHVVWRIMEFIGATHENEIMAYYNGYLVREVCRFLCKVGNPTLIAPSTNDTSVSATPSTNDTSVNFTA